MSKTRRRGSELEAAVFEATRTILKNEGFVQLTFSKVADLAETSKTVIYRHWDSPFALAIAAIQDKIKKENNGRLDQLQLTGKNMREDLFQVLKRFTASMDAFGNVFFNTWFSGLDEQKTKTLRDMIQQAKSSDIKAINNVLQRSLERGEITSTDLSPELKLMPYEIIRYYGFTNEAVDDQAINMLVDDVFIPAYEHALKK